MTWHILIIFGGMAAIICGGLYWNRSLTLRVKQAADLVRQSYEAQYEQERHYRDMLESVHLIALTLDKNGAVVFVNDHFLEITGWRRDEVMGADWYATFLPPQIQKKYGNTFQDSFPNSQLVRHVTYPIVKKDGTELIISWNRSFLLHENKPDKMVSIGMDVTQQHQYQALIAESERKLREILENSRDAFFRREPGRPERNYISPAAFDIAGYDPEWISRQGVLAFIDRIHPEDMDLFTAQHNKLKAAGSKSSRHSDFDIRIRHKKGHWVWINFRLTGIYKPDGSLKAIVGTSRNITDLKAIQKKLNETEYKFKQLFESSPNGILMADGEGTLLEVNEAFQSIVEASSANDLLGRNIRDIMPQEWVPQTNALYHLLETGGMPNLSFEKEYYKMDGTRIPVEVHGWTIQNSESKKLGIGAFVRDITKDRDLAAAKSSLERQLQQMQKMEAIGTLSAGIAHDFNNILWGITGYTELSIDQLQADDRDEASSSMKHVLEAGVRAKELVKQILHFSRQSNGDVCVLDMATIVKEIVNLFKAMLPATMEVDLSIPEGLYRVQAEATGIHQVIMNLCTNAYQSMQGGHGRLSIQLSNIQTTKAINCQGAALAPGDYMEIRISDTGYGISPKKMDQIFDPYFTTKGKDEGTGLGLAVSLGIIRNHQGGIMVESTVGKGSTFRIFLPSHQEACKIPEEFSQAPLRGGNERILFVDDEPVFLDLTDQMLGSLGYQLSGFTDSVTAFRAFQERPHDYDMVITDQTMPKLTGLELSKKVHEIRPDIPIVLCSGFSESITKGKLLRAGVSEILYKPVSRSGLASTVRNVLDHKGA